MSIPRISRTFGPTRAAADVGRRLPPLVVLRAPRGFGKTSTVASWVSAGGPFDVAWLTVPEEPMAAEALWRAVHDALVRSGHAQPGPDPAPAAVRAALGALDRRLVLVLDGLHNVSDPTVDSALVGLVQEHELFHLVATTRAERPLEHLGPATVDAVVLRVRDLALTDEDIRTLAGRLGLPLTAAEAGRLRKDLLGWPALVRAVLLDSSRRVDGTLDLDLAPVRHYADAVLHDPDFAPYYRLVTTLAVPETFTVEDVRRLSGEASPGDRLEDLRDAGLVVDVGDGTLTMPRSLRAAAAAVLERDDPARFRDVHAVVAGDGSVPVTAALQHAVQAAAWPVVVELVDDHWTELVRVHRDALRAVMAAVPDAVVASSARLVLARDHVLDAHTASRAAQALRSGLLTPDGILVGQEPTTTQRLAMHSLTAWGPRGPVSRALASGAGASAEVRAELPGLLVEWSLSALYEADLLGASYGFAMAGRWAPRPSAVAREAAAGTALTLALLGHLPDAERWLAHADGLGAERPELEVAARAVVEAVRAVARLGDDSAPEVPRPGHGSPLAPLAPLARLILTHRAVYRGDTSGVVPAVEQARATREAYGGAPLVAAAMTAILCDCHLVDGAFDRCAALLAGAGPSQRGLAPARARHAFYVGAHEEALRLTEPAEEDAACAPRLALELLVVRACAARRAGDDERALAALSAAVALAEDVGMLVPFLTVPRADLEAIAAGSPVLRAFLATEPLASAPSPFPEPLHVSQLSAAEHRVLQHLSGPRPLAHIARALYVSESTVKTHVQRIYRKLGVTTRAAAVTRARELAILREPVESRR